MKRKEDTPTTMMLMLMMAMSMKEQNPGGRARMKSQYQENTLNAS